QRLIPLRTVALAACLREIRMPSRAGPCARVRKKIVKPDRLLREPSRSNCSKSAFLASRLSAPSPKRDGSACLLSRGTPGARLNGETLATLCPPRAQYRTTIGGAAAHQKTVRSCAA